MRQNNYKVMNLQLLDVLSNSYSPLIDKQRKHPGPHVRITSLHSREAMELLHSESATRQPTKFYRKCLILLLSTYWKSTRISSKNSGERGGAGGPRGGGVTCCESAAQKTTKPTPVREINGPKTTRFVRRNVTPQ